MVMLALVALLASVLIWAAPSSQAQGNQAPFADAGPDQTVNPGVGVTLTGAGSVDVDGGADDCTGCEYDWEVVTGPYDWIQIGEDSTTATDANTTPAAYLEVPSEAFVDKVADSDPQKYEIVVRLTVTDNRGATDSDTVSININQRPVADIQLYAGLRDKDVVDADLGAAGHFPIDAVIDGPGENGNRDNEWDVMEGAWLQLTATGSTDENPSTGRPSSYMWTRVRPATLANYTDSQSTASATALRLTVPTGTSGDANEVIINFGDLDEDGNANEDGNVATDPPQIAERLVAYTLPNVEPRAPQTVFYRLTVCDSSPAVETDITTAANCTNGRTGSTLIRIVVHDTSATPEVSIGAALTTASKTRSDAAPQSTVSQFTGVDNQFIVDAGSTVRLTATVKDDDQTEGHNFRWSGATAVAGTNTATVRVPADADDGDTIDGSVTVTDATRISVTTTFQLLVGENTRPTAGGVPVDATPIINTLPAPAPTIHFKTYSDGVQNARDGATVTLRGVGNDADGDSIVTAWALRVAPNQAAIETAVTNWIADPTTAATAISLVGGALANLEEPEKPLIELNGALTDTVTFDVPDLENGTSKSTFLLFNVIDSKGVSAQQFIYLRITGDDDAPNAKAGADQQVDPEAFVRLNGSASSDPDVGDTIKYSWEYVGATMDPAPDERSRLSASEITALDGWILEKADDGTFTYIVNAAGMLTGDSDKLKSTKNAYPYFDAPDLTGFNNLKLTFRLHVKDSATDLNGDGDTVDTNLTSLDEADFGVDLDGDDALTTAAVTSVNEALLGLDLDGDGDAVGTVDLSAVTNSADGNAGVDEARVGEVDTDDVTITVVNRYFSGNIPGPDFCTNRSLGGPQTYPLDSDRDGVADTCSLNTTRRATVARQNALETLANLNPTEFRNAVNAVCGAAGFKQANYGDDPEDLKTDACETGRVTPPPAAADPATADVFFSGVITGPDFCTNEGLGGARLYALDSDGDGVADTCSLSTTRREAIARQNGLKTFIVTFSAAETTRLADLSEWIEIFETAEASRTSAQIRRLNVLNAQYATEFDDSAAETVGVLDNGNAGSEVAEVKAAIKTLTDKRDGPAARYSNALAAECRALGTQDFGDAASALARDECVTTPSTGQALS